MTDKCVQCMCILTLGYVIVVIEMYMWIDFGLCLMFLCVPCRYEYRLTKEYNWNVKNKASKGYEVSLHAHTILTG